MTETKLHALLVEGIDDLGEVGERAGQPVHFVDHDRVDLAGGDVREKLLQRLAAPCCRPRNRHRRTIGEKLPAFMPLAQDVGLAGLALGVEGVEGLFQSFFGRLAGVDRTTNLSLSRRHEAFTFFVPKKAGPDQRVPVISHAIGDRLLYVFPK